MALKRNVDPVLEKLRNEVDGPPNLDTLALISQRFAANIHAAFLFEKEGKLVLHQLCLLLSATANGKLYSGWKEFGAQLGLSLEQIQCIDYNFKGLQDPTYYVLLAYIQWPEATLDKIIVALQKIGRLDIVNRIHENMSKFIECLDLKDDTNDVQKPKYIPRAPMVLSPMIHTKEELQTRSYGCGNSSEASPNSETHKMKKSSPYYGSIVMLTYAHDGAIVAKNIAKIFRATEPKIGVVILEEQEKYVYSRAEEFVDDCFKQVNYIVPILTSGYVKSLNQQPDIELENRCLDTKYLKYIYSLMRFEYAKNSCCNNRVRCIVPESEVSTVLKSDLHPILQAWFREADIEAFTENILLRKI
ncbi:uncharacterized protein [Venturia canescens]|uniref:uncharacterized protein n=1 Tax=Venturia canescens TaxID=32260 RepID=UPI001C9BD248|nr:uncharacterized protein LOC122407254 [Venturia canescens]